MTPLLMCVTPFPRFGSPDAYFLMVSSCQWMTETKLTHFQNRHVLIFLLTISLTRFLFRLVAALAHAHDLFG